jgi:hypothetical protein
MLRVRVLMQPLAGGEAQTVWDRPLRAKHEDRKLQEFRELSWSTQKFGERIEMRFDDDSGGHCRVDANFQGAHIFPIEGGTQVDLSFAGDKYRVW